MKRIKDKENGLLGMNHSQDSVVVSSCRKVLSYCEMNFNLRELKETKDALRLGETGYIGREISILNGNTYFRKVLCEQSNLTIYEYKNEYNVLSKWNQTQTVNIDIFQSLGQKEERKYCFCWNSSHALKGNKKLFAKLGFILMIKKGSSINFQKTYIFVLFIQV